MPMPLRAQAVRPEGRVLRPFVKDHLTARCCQAILDQLRRERMSDNTFWAILILGLVVVVPVVQSWISKKYKSEGRPDEARNVLETRYALGEIDDDEFARKME